MPDFKLASYLVIETPPNWLLVRDFNQHHWLWSPHNIPQLKYKQEYADILIDVILNLALIIFTDKGAIMRRERVG